MWVSGTVFEPGQRRCGSTKELQKFRLGLVQESLGRDDYIWATKALSFLRPHWWQDHEDHRALENALLKTQTLALKTKK